MNRLLLAATLSSFSLLSAAAYDAVAQPAAASPGGMLITAGELAAAAKDPSLVVLHVADRASGFEEAHLPGARFLRYADFAIDGGQGLGSELPSVDDVRRVFEVVGVSNGSRVVVYAASPVMAARAFFTLEVMGHPRVALLDGGLRVWREEGRAIETGAAKAATPGHFMPVLNPARLASAQLIQQQMPSGGIALVDVRPIPSFSAPTAAWAASTRRVTSPARSNCRGTRWCKTTGASCPGRSCKPSSRQQERRRANPSCRTAWSACAHQSSTLWRGISDTRRSCMTGRSSTGRSNGCR